MELIDEIQEKQLKCAKPVSKHQGTLDEMKKSSQPHMKWIPKSNSFKKKVKEKMKDKVGTKKKVKTTKDTNQVYTLSFYGSKCTQGANI